MNAQKHKELLEKYLQNGGNKRLADSVRAFSLQSYAKLKYEVSSLSPIANSQEPRAQNQEQTNDSQKQEAKSEKRKVFSDFIADYPAVLHPVFRRRWELWLLACSLKIQLNGLSQFANRNSMNAKTEEKAFEIQWRIWQCFKEFDDCQKILKHYQEHKRIMPFKTDKNLNELTEIELFKQRNNLRALITRRQQTIAKMEMDLPSAKSEKPTATEKKFLHTLNLKREALQEKITELNEIEKLLKNE